MWFQVLQDDQLTKGPETDLPSAFLMCNFVPPLGNYFGGGQMPAFDPSRLRSRLIHILNNAFSTHCKNGSQPEPRFTK